MPFIPHTPADLEQMLAAVGARSIDDLFDEIPPALRIKSLQAVPAGLNEFAVGRLMRERAAMDGAPLNFIGAGAYEHHIPAAVWAIATRGEFYSAYTPYQAEASQGTLQTIYEYQTMMASLTGMEVSNATLYDGASALAEAALMAVRAHRRDRSRRFLHSAALHPHYRDVAFASAGQQGLQFLSLAYQAATGRLDRATVAAAIGEGACALIIQQPNFFGMLEDVDTLTDLAHEAGLMVIAVVNPTAMAVLKPPGQWGARGADIVVGEGQPLGVPLSSGGPYFGFMTTRMEYVRQMPGRIVGRTVDLDGRTGYALTLQAREQHIRRGKATSNICTNQGLLMTAATIYMSLLGPLGLASVARQSMQRLRELCAALTKIPGVELAFTGPRFHEAVLRLPQPVAPILARLARQGILGGIDLLRSYPDLGPALLLAATETKTTADIERYAEALRSALAAERAA
ncbi:MAG: aminomethyl-transferring glycine dehydrogenase subunit GcvPA [Steroidobacteraceae bacterium]